ncbi:hypothetical protein SAMN02745866_01218 [Alteromonadaceae bacterium Bs31]|nr:hypothetical protein SAMN02745866_01218 [Alteromonadaceae bacterium Bs31]
MYPVINRVYAQNGECWSTPASSLNACWAALGAGADALVLQVFLTKDSHPVCAPCEALPLSMAGSSSLIRELSLESLQQLDAGLDFQSTKLDQNFQPTGEKGEDRPWRGLKQEHPLKDRQAVFFPSLQQVLELFSRRTALCLVLPDGEYPLMDELISECVTLMQRFGIAAQTTCFASLASLQKMRGLCDTCGLGLQQEHAPDMEALKQLCALEGKSIAVQLDAIQALSDAERQTLFQFANEHQLGWVYSSNSMPCAPSPQTLLALASYSCRIEAWLSQSALATRSAVAPSGLIFEESFTGKQLRTAYWSAGYSHINMETEISVDDALVINIHKGEKYSGGAAICLLPVHGDFDVQVSFHVANPHQATTFELAAIGIDPGYPHLENSDLNTRTANLTFDVHGAPPYASSERDQNDGFRCGWNNSFNFAKFEQDWSAASSNMYNKYGRDVGDGSKENLNGNLRLLRTGPLFNAYYRDKHNGEWVCSGTMLVQNMPKDTYLRLAAKHWHKVHPAPPNTVRFRDFKIHQA